MGDICTEVIKGCSESLLEVTTGVLTEAFENPPFFSMYIFATGCEVEIFGISGYGDKTEVSASPVTLYISSSSPKTVGLINTRAYIEKLNFKNLINPMILTIKQKIMQIRLLSFQI